MSPIRTLHIIDRLDKKLGGSVQATLGVCKYLAQAGQPVEAAGSIGPGDQLDHLERDFPEFCINQFPRSFPKRYANSAEFARWLPTVLARYDLVEIHAIFSAFTLRAAAICRALGKPYLVRPHGSLDPFDLRKHALLKKIIGPTLIRTMLEGASAILLTAPWEAERLESYGANVLKVVLPLPVALPAGKGNGSAFRQKHSIPQDAIVVLFMSRIDYKKGLDFLIPALARLKPDIPQLWFVMAGTGPADFVQRVNGWIFDHGLRSFTSEVGFVGGQEKLDALAAADVFALPSLNENFGIVNIEAMHAGVPLLISDEVYICREIADAGAGRICKPSIESVTSILRQMLHGDVDLRAMGQRGRALVQRSYRPEAATATLIKLYAQTADRAIHHAEPGTT